MEKMVRGCRADFCGESRASCVGEFVGMDLPSEARGLRAIENSSGLVRREESVVDEDIAERGETRTRDRVHHVAGDELDIGFRAPLEFRRNRVCSEEGPNDMDAGRLTGFRRSPKDFELIPGPESVSALHLDRRRPESEHGSEALGGGPGELLLADFSRRPHGVYDATPPGRDLP